MSQDTAPACAKTPPPLVSRHRPRLCQGTAPACAVAQEYDKDILVLIEKDELRARCGRGDIYWPLR